MSSSGSKLRATAAEWKPSATGSTYLETAQQQVSPIPSTGGAGQAIGGNGGGGFRLPPSATGGVAPYEHQGGLRPIDGESAGTASSGMPTPPLGFKPSNMHNDYEDEGEFHGGNHFAPGGIHGDAIADYMGSADDYGYDEGFLDWDAQMTTWRHEYEKGVLALYEDIEDEEGNVDLEKMYRQMREMQIRQIEKQIADENAFLEAQEEKWRKQKEEQANPKDSLLARKKEWKRKVNEAHNNWETNSSRASTVASYAPSSASAAGGAGGGGAGKGKNAGQQLDPFSQALLHNASPFMPALKQRCGASLPHIKVDQRFGKKNQPHTAVMQFVVAPVVSGYRPRHFHEISPGDLMEFHYDFALVIKNIKSACSIAYSYGPEWKPFNLPYCFLSCVDYRKEVLSLCPHEVPNSKADAIYADDVVKDVTQLILAIPELNCLRKQSFVTAMARRADFGRALYKVFNEVFASIVNYQIQVRDLHETPSRFLLKTSESVLLDVKGPVTIGNDPDIWSLLPLVDSTFSTGKTAAPTAVGGSASVGPRPVAATGDSGEVFATAGGASSAKPAGPPGSARDTTKPRGKEPKAEKSSKRKPDGDEGRSEDPANVAPPAASAAGAAVQLPPHEEKATKQPKQQEGKAEQATRGNRTPQPQPPHPVAVAPIDADISEPVRPPPAATPAAATGPTPSTGSAPSARATPTTRRGDGSSSSLMTVSIGLSVVCLAVGVGSILYVLRRQK